MGKDNEKEDSGFGFKDKAKAEETLKLLESHDPNYRRLTVRGLLGRAKRVLTMTKAEEKIKNIKEAMEVFENWLADLDKDKEAKKKSSEKKSSDTKSSSNSAQKERKAEGSDVEMEDKEDKEKSAASETVPGLGFKDLDAAQRSLQILEGRDPDYQKLAVKGLIGRAKRVLTCTRDESKLNNIKEAINLFDKFLDDFDSLHLSKQNNPYLPLDVVENALQIAKSRGIECEEQVAFIETYRTVKGEYKRLRTIEQEESETTWDIVRNKALKGLKQKYADVKLFDSKDAPTDEHLSMLLWSYSPEPAKAKKLVKQESERKRKSSGGEVSPSKKQKD